MSRGMAHPLGRKARQGLRMLVSSTPLAQVQGVRLHDTLGHSLTVPASKGAHAALQRAGRMFLCWSHLTFTDVDSEEVPRC